APHPRPLPKGAKGENHPSPPSLTPTRARGDRNPADVDVRRHEYESRLGVSLSGTAGPVHHPPHTACFRSENTMSAHFVRAALIVASVLSFAAPASAQVLDAEDELEAVRKAAEKGDANAMHSLGWAYASGKGVKKDD